MSDAPDQYGVVGHPVAHSWSPFIHGLFARETGQSIHYRLYDFAPAQFRERVAEFFAAGGRGLNITLPHKLAAVQVAAELTPRAARAQAVNTLVRQADGRLLGDNTDGVGLVNDLCRNYGVLIARRRVLMLGAGGAARGALVPLLALQPSALVIANRGAERAQALAADFLDLGPVSGTGLDRVPPGPFDVIINATSASLGGETPAIADSVVGPDSVCYDMAYGKTDTAFMRWAQERRCGQAMQGWGMLIEQAAESFRVWRGVHPPTGPVLAALRERASKV